MEKIGEFFFSVERRYGITFDRLFIPKLNNVFTEFTEDECVSYLKPFEDGWLPNEGKMFGYIVVYDNIVELHGENDYNKKQKWYDPEMVWVLTKDPEGKIG